MPRLIPDQDKLFGGSLVLDVKTIYFPRKERRPWDEIAACTCAASFELNINIGSNTNPERCKIQNTSKF